MIEAKIEGQHREAENPVLENVLRGRYVYGVVSSGEAVGFGVVGIENNRTYTISYEDLYAIVHDCPPHPYESASGESIRGWVEAHQKVLEEAKKKFECVIPLSFNTILLPRDASHSPEDTVKSWLQRDYYNIRILLNKFRHMDEYGVQVFYNNEQFCNMTMMLSEKLQKIQNDISTKSPGVAYIYKQKLKQGLNSEINMLADQYFNDFYEKIKKYCVELIVEKTKKSQGDGTMLINLSCLVAQENVRLLGEELENIQATAGFSVRFTGPWPPYSFVAELFGDVENKESGNIR